MGAALEGRDRADHGRARGRLQPLGGLHGPVEELPYEGEPQPQPQPQREPEHDVQGDPRLDRQARPLRRLHQADPYRRAALERRHPSDERVRHGTGKPLRPSAIGVLHAQLDEQRLGDRLGTDPRLQHGRADRLGIGPQGGFHGGP